MFCSNLKQHHRKLCSESVFYIIHSNHRKFVKFTELHPFSYFSKISWLWFAILNLAVLELINCKGTFNDYFLEVS